MYSFIYLYETSSRGFVLSWPFTIVKGFRILGYSFIFHKKTFFVMIVTEQLDTETYFYIQSSNDASFTLEMPNLVHLDKMPPRGFYIKVVQYSFFFQTIPKFFVLPFGNLSRLWSVWNYTMYWS